MRGSAVVAAVMLVGAGAGGVVTLSSRLDESERLRATAEADARTATRELHDAERELARAEARVERLLQARLAERAAERGGCFEEQGRPPHDVRGPLRGDVDGDGSADAVYAVGLPIGRAACAYHVAVLGDGGAVATAPVRTARHATRTADLRLFLQPSFLVELNETPGLEVAVATSRGAAGAGYQLFTFLDGALLSMERPGSNGWAFGAYASAGGGSGLDCAGHGRIVEGRYGYSVTSEDHEVERSFYRVVGAALVPDGVETHDRPRTGGFPELERGDAVPFPSCDARIPAAP